jgi:hypothetical protein
MRGQQCDRQYEGTRRGRFTVDAKIALSFGGQVAKYLGDA